jgi:hypothetical protein
MPPESLTSDARSFSHALEFGQGHLWMSADGGFRHESSEYDPHSSSSLFPRERADYRDDPEHLQARPAANRSAVDRLL